MIIYGKTLAVLYVDVTLATGANTGNTPTDALKLLPAITALAANTVYLCRRTILNQPVNGLTTPTSGNSLTLSSGTCATDFTYIIGMPKSTDPLYKVVPAAAISAWAADAADYAGLQVPDGSGATGVNNAHFTGIHIGFSRLALFSPNTNGGNVGSNQACISFNQASGLTQFFLTYSQWTLSGVNLKTTNTTINRVYQPLYLCFVSASQKIEIDNCYIQQQRGVVSTTQRQSSFLYAAAANNYLSVSNINYVFSAGPGFNGATFNNGTSFIYTQAATFTVNLTNINLVMQIQDTTLGAAGQGPGASGIGIQVSNGNVFVDGLTFKIDRYMTGVTGSNVFTTNTYLHQIIMILTTSGNGYQNINVTNIDIDLGDIGAGISAGNICNINLGASNAIIGTVKNIKINTNVGHTKTTQTSPTCVGLNLVNAQNLYQLSNLTVNTLQNIAYQYTIGNGATNSRCAYNNINLKGKLSVQNCGFMYINSLDTSFHLNTPVISLTTSSSSSNVYINSLILNSNTWSSPPYTLNANTYLMINQTTTYPSAGTSIGNVTDSALNWASIPSISGQILVNNRNGNTGSWYSHNYYYRAETNATARTGGASSSVKFNSTVLGTYQANRPLTIAPWPYKGIQWTPTTGQSGNNYLVYYLAYKSFTTPSDLHPKFNFVMQVPYTDVNNTPSAGGPIYQKFNSRSHGNWMADSSVWTGDSGLTIVKMVMPFNCPLENVPINIRIEFNAYDISGYIYLDPKLEIYNAAGTLLFS